MAKEEHSFIVFVYMADVRQQHLVDSLPEESGSWTPLQVKMMTDSACLPYDAVSSGSN